MPLPESASRTARRVRLAGIAILIVGWIAAAAVYVTAHADADVDATAQQREMRQLERLGGTATVQTVRFDGWLSSLWHGERLPVTLAVLSFLVAGACWYIGGLMGEDVDPA